MIAVADVVKPTSREAVRQFKEYGIHVIMLTGDNEVTAQAIKDQVGIDEVIAGVLPTQKEEKISALKNSGHKVAMIETVSTMRRRLLPQTWESRSGQVRM